MKNYASAVKFVKTERNEKVFMKLQFRKKLPLWKTASLKFRQLFERLRNRQDSN